MTVLQKSPFHGVNPKSEPPRNQYQACLLSRHVSGATRLDVHTCILAVGPTSLFSSLGGGKVCGHTEGHLITTARVQAVVLHQPKAYLISMG